MEKKGRPPNRKRNREVIAVLRKHGNYTKAAKELGITRQGVQDFARRNGYGLVAKLSRTAKKISLDMRK